MKTILILFTFMALCLFSSDVYAQPGKFQLDAQSKTSIVLPQQATRPDQTAASELKNYLTKITGGSFSILTENSTATSSPAIYIGATKFAKSAGLSIDKLSSEEWRIKAENGNLILIGGGSRGTLYATYHFLEDVAGVHWWNPYEESVPSLKVLSLKKLDLHGQPTFAYRDIYSTYGYDNGRFAIRNRLNRDGDSPIGAEHGGSNDYGPPYFVHTFYKILSPQKYFHDHPDWFIGNGAAEPTSANSQLAMSNPEMRNEFLKLFIDLIRKSQQAAIAKGLPAPSVYSVSQEDNNIKFATPMDDALLKDNGGADSAVLIDFVNFLADRIKDEFPDVYIDTLAYYSGETAPTTIRPRDNVIIRLTDTSSNLLLPISAPRNRKFHDDVVEWSKVAKNLRIWDYAVTYTNTGLPLPTANTYQEDFRFFASHHVEGVFIEHEFPILGDMRDMKVWLQCKLLEDPDLNYDKLLQEFTDGYYGAAGSDIRQYLSLRSQQVASFTKTPDIDWFAPSHRYRYLKEDFAIQANAIFSKAAQAVSDDAILSRRVRHSRFSLDRAILLFSNKWTRNKSSEVKDSPLARDIVAARYLETWNEQTDLRLPEAQRAAQRKFASDDIAKLTAAPAVTFSLPEKFRDVPASKIVAYSARDTVNHGRFIKVVPDPQTETGIATRLEITDDTLSKYQLPLQWGTYEVKKRKGLGGGEIKAEDIPGPGYHWYKLGNSVLTESSYLYLLRDWTIQINIDALDDDKETQQFEIWAKIKFEGPAFPHGGVDQPNSISIERVVLLKDKTP